MMANLTCQVTVGFKKESGIKLLEMKVNLSLNPYSPSLFSSKFLKFILIFEKNYLTYFCMEKKSVKYLVRSFITRTCSKEQIITIKLAAQFTNFFVSSKLIEIV